MPCAVPTAQSNVGITCKVDVQWWRLPLELKTTPRGARRSLHWTNSSFSSGGFMTPDLPLSRRQFHVCDCDLDILLHTSSYNSTSNATRISAITTPSPPHAAPASTRPPLLSWCPQGEALKERWIVWLRPLSDSYHLRRCRLLAALHGSQDGCISGVSSLLSENKTLRLTVCLKMDSCATCRYVWGTLIIHLMPFKHGTAWQVCLWWWIPSVPVYACMCVCVCVCVCVCATMSLPLWVTYRRKQEPRIKHICPASL